MAISPIFLRPCQPKPKKYIPLFRMQNTSPHELLPEQTQPLDALKASIQSDASPDVQAELNPLQEAIEKNDRGEVMTALRTLESRLESLSAVEQHREKLREAKYAVGNMLDDFNSIADHAVDTAKSYINPIIDASKPYVPGASGAIDTMKPSVDSMKEAYAKLPTALRLPVLGAAVAGTAWLASYPVKWFGKLVGYVSPKGQKAFEDAAKGMKKAGVIVFGGGVLASIVGMLGNKYQEGAFDSTLDAMKSTYDSAKDKIMPAATPDAVDPSVTPPAAPAPTPTPAPAPSATAPVAPATAPSAAAPVAPPVAPSVAPPATLNRSFDELKAGVTIDGKNVRLLDGPKIVVGTKTWNIKLPRGAKLLDAHIDHGSLIVEGGRWPISQKITLSENSVKRTLDELATTTLRTVAMTNDDGSPVTPETSFELV